ncbi:hypothetical protein Scep_009255 [Stephania cephalantha]|uniref:Uncharacterized protein n=1 Tax=Stephania cephalantha TaxID=152367 RepID=A0AAP0JTE6_9MAGN
MSRDARCSIYNESINKYVFDVPRVPFRANLEDTFDLKSIRKREIRIRRKKRNEDREKGEREKEEKKEEGSDRERSRRGRRRKRGGGRRWRWRWRTAAAARDDGGRRNENGAATGSAAERRSGADEGQRGKQPAVGVAWHLASEQSVSQPAMRPGMLWRCGKRGFSSGKRNAVNNAMALSDRSRRIDECRRHDGGMYAGKPGERKWGHPLKGSGRGSPAEAAAPNERQRLIKNVRVARPPESSSGGMAGSNAMTVTTSQCDDAAAAGQQLLGSSVGFQLSGKNLHV